MDENEAIMAQVNARRPFAGGCAHGRVCHEPADELCEARSVFDLVTFSSQSGMFAAHPTRRLDGLQLFYWPHRTGD